ncbi:hypothetical protein FDW91_04100 [Citrobacter sp. wls831]|nr:hypothetical protein A6J81_22390 [Citrobacter braakii]TKU03571.1 hypothetical protein FDW91_04100 [Citrobacter sp. wls831]
MFFFNRRAKKQGQLEKRSFDKLALANNPIENLEFQAIFYFSFFKCILTSFQNFTYMLPYTHALKKASILYLFKSIFKCIIDIFKLILFILTIFNLTRLVCNNNTF